MKISWIEIEEEFKTVLDFGNFVRKDNGYQEIDALVKGFRGNAEEDVIVHSIQHGAPSLASVAFHESVGVYDYMTGEKRNYKTPEIVVEFMKKFDSGQIPELSSK